MKFPYAVSITSLNPLLACGWFAGLVEATIRKPSVQDVMSVCSDISSTKGFYQNRFLKALMVVVLGNIRSSLGTYIAGIDMIKIYYNNLLMQPVYLDSLPRHLAASKKYRFCVFSKSAYIRGDVQILRLFCPKQGMRRAIIRVIFDHERHSLW
ncbi:MAG TPA: hypothetical protein PLK94_15000 [Alphaproteobacteria bacterium]|nr:hypothetical protein [Alphaproteobacteria bacterium]